MATITSIDEFKTYILQKLGYPILTIELSSDQLTNSIEESCEIFNRYNSGEGNFEDYMALHLTSGVSEYSLSGQDIIAAIQFDASIIDGINQLFTAQNMLLGSSDFMSSRIVNNYGLVDFQISMMYMEEIRNAYGILFNVTYNEGRQVLTIRPTPTQNLVGLLKVYKKEKFINLYNNRLVKDLAIALAKHQWGNNISKYSVSLPGGGQINGKDILIDAKEEIKTAKEAIISESEPIDFYIQ
jgi:hypothetical protein